MTSPTPKMVYVKKISNYRLLPPKSDRAWMRKLPGHWPDSTTGHQVTIRQFHLDDGDYFMMRPQKTPGKDAGPSWSCHGSLSDYNNLGVTQNNLVLGPLSEDDSPWYVMSERKTNIFPYMIENQRVNKMESFEKQVKRELLGEQFSAKIKNSLKIKYILMRQDKQGGSVSKSYLLTPLARGDLACAQPGIMAEADKLAYLAHQGLQLIAENKDKPANDVMLQKMSFRDIIPRDALEWHRRNLAGYSLMLALALQLKPLHDANILHSNIGPQTVFRDLETGWPRLGGFDYSWDLNKEDFYEHYRFGLLVRAKHNWNFRAPELYPEFVIYKKPLCGRLFAPLKGEEDLLKEGNNLPYRRGNNGLLLRADVFSLGLLVFGFIMPEPLPRLAYRSEERNFRPPCYTQIEIDDPRLVHYSNYISSSRKGFLSLSDEAVSEINTFLGILAENLYIFAKQQAESNFQQQAESNLSRRFSGLLGLFGRADEPKEICEYYKYIDKSDKLWEQCHNLQPALAQLLAESLCYSCDMRPSVQQIIPRLRQSFAAAYPGRNLDNEAKIYFSNLGQNMSFEPKKLLLANIVRKLNIEQK